MNYSIKFKTKITETHEGAAALIKAALELYFQEEVPLEVTPIKVAQLPKEEGRVDLKELQGMFAKWMEDNISNISHYKEGAIFNFFSSYLSPSPAEVKDKEWISVEDRLPELGGEYLCVWDLEDGLPPVVASMDYDHKKKVFTDPRGEVDMERTGILAWRELPEFNPLTTTN